MSDIDLVTGAFGYTGSYLSRALLTDGRKVRTLTNHPRPTAGLQRDIEVFPYSFDDRNALVGAMRGVDTIYNTYWARYVHAGTSYDQAVVNSRALIDAAAEAGVRRFVHVSITKPHHDSFYAYYRGKAEVEDALTVSGLSHAIVRPTVIFGGNDIFINNIAWLLRTFPVFAIPGDGTYRLRPVAVWDLAELCIRLGAASEDTTVDAVGPETFTFEELVTTIGDAVGARTRLVHVPPAVAAAVMPLLRLVTGDVVLTRDEIDGLMAEYIHVDGAATCPTRLTDYLATRGREVGIRYSSELNRRRHVDSDPLDRPVGSQTSPPMPATT